MTRSQRRRGGWAGQLSNVLENPYTRAAIKMATDKMAGEVRKQYNAKVGNNKFSGQRAKPVKQARTIIPAAPRNTGVVMKTGTPQMKVRHNANQSITVRHRERFGKVTLGLTPVVSSFALQPAIGTGESHMFPWLATIAQNYEFYKFTSVRISYCPNTGTDTQGHVIIAPDYDALDVAPADGVQMESYKSSVSGPAWQGLECILAPGDLAKRSPKYTRTTSLPFTNADLKTYDTANIWVYTEDGPATGPITTGYLYVDYVVELHTPARHDPFTAATSKAMARDFFGSNGSVYFTGLVNTNPGTGMLNVTVTSDGRLEISGQPGQYYGFMSNATEVPDPSLFNISVSSGAEKVALFTRTNAIGAPVFNFHFTLASRQDNIKIGRTSIGGYAYKLLLWPVGKDKSVKLLASPIYQQTTMHQLEEEEDEEAKFTTTTKSEDSFEEVTPSQPST